MSEELRPCPFCGKDRASLAVNQNKREDAWVSCCCRAKGPFYGGSDSTSLDEAIELWNSAYCWKQIDAQASTIRQQAETIEKLREALENVRWANELGIQREGSSESKHRIKSITDEALAATDPNGKEK